MSGFGGFPKEALGFLKGLERNNKKEWFDANRAVYEEALLEPAKEFVIAEGSRLQKLAPQIQFEPRVNGSIRRLNRDIRFSNDKRPYKNHLDIHFSHDGGLGCGAPAFFFRIQANSLGLGVGMHMFDKPFLAKFRKAVIEEKTGAALARAVDKLKSAGFKIAGKFYKKTPRGLDAAHKRAEFLQFNSLYVYSETAPPKEISTGRFVDYCFGEYKKLMPIYDWLAALACD